MLVQDPNIALLPDGPAGPRRFKIKSAESEERRSKVNSLLRDRYSWRGYGKVSLPTDHSVHKFTLTAIEDDNTIGTITVAMDGPQKLSTDAAFSREVQALRDQGRKLCEFTKLAVDPTVATKRVLAALFHVAYIVANRIRGHDTLLIEVNPRHVRYYERMLGFKALTEARHNASVNAPAVLLAVDFAYVMSQIGEYGGQPERSNEVRSLYPVFFSLTEEAGILSKMQTKQRAHDRRLTDTGHPSPAPTDFVATDMLGY